MRLRRLGWAGVEIETAGGTLVIDPLENASPLAPHVGEAREPLPGPKRAGSALLARHPPALRPRRPGGHSRGARTRRVAAAPGAHAGRGARGRRHGHLGGRHRGARHTDPDLRAVGDGPHRPIRGDGGARGRRVRRPADIVGGCGGGAARLHGGDTLFHGWWWRTRMRCGPIDVAFLPVNGALVDLPHRQPPSPLPIVMDPAQAASAAVILGTRAAVPIHYGAFHSPPAYAQVDDPAGAFVAAAEADGVEAVVLDPGEGFEPKD